MNQGITFAVLLAAAPAVADKPKLAVMPLAPQNIKAETVQIIDGLLTSEIDRAGRYQVLGVDDINAMLGFERMKDAAGCSDVVCAVEIGGALGVRYLVTGSVGRMGGELIVQLTLIDVSESAAASRGRAVVEDKEVLYRRAIERAAASLLGVEAKTSTAVGGGKVSPARFRFDTVEVEHEFDVEVMTMDGSSHRCDPPVRRSISCGLNGLVVGEARLSVASAGLTSFVDDFTVRDSDELFAIEIETRAGPGSVISWSLGGTALGIGIGLTATGFGTDTEGLIYGGAPTAVVGALVLGLGFFFNRLVDVNYPGIDVFF